MIDKPHLIFRNQQDLAIHFITSFLCLSRKSTNISGKKNQKSKVPLTHDLSKRTRNNEKQHRV
jgi:hypothetical protein